MRREGRSGTDEGDISDRFDVELPQPGAGGSKWAPRTPARPSPPEPGGLDAAYPLFVVDGDQRIVSWNRRAAEDLGLRPTAAGRLCYEVMSALDPRNAAVCRPGCSVITESRCGQIAIDFEIGAGGTDGSPGRAQVSILLQQGARGPDARVVHLVRPIRQSAGGASAPRRSAAVRAPGQGGSLLTPRQLATLRLLAQGCSVHEIAQTLGVRVVTARNHVQAAMDRLGARNRLEAVLIASRIGVLSEFGS